MLLSPSRRPFWLALSGSALALEATALYFQYVTGLDPCVLCVYERVAVAGILLAGLLGLVAPGLRIWRLPCYGIWAASAIWGLMLAMKHVGIQFGTSDLSCDFFANFPAWFKLDEWLPAVFKPTGYCTDIQWQLFGFTMPQWMLGIFTGYLLLLVVALIVEFRKPATPEWVD